MQQCQHLESNTTQYTLEDVNVKCKSKKKKKKN
jgi:hypothetical protein